MRTLILSCNTGAGHNACAGAIQEAMMARGMPCDIRDGLGFLSKEASRFISEWHTRLYRAMPKLYGEGYSYAEKRAQKGDDDSLLFKVMSRGAKSLRACIESQGYGAVVCTHLFPAMMLTQLQRQDPLPLKTAFVSTDYTASPGYETICTDWCFIPDRSLVPDFVKPDMPAERIVGCGIPVMRQFQTRGDMAAAKRTLGVDPAHRHLLIMSGSMGCGPIRKIVKRLGAILPEDVEISVICATNGKLSRQLNSLVGDRRNIHIHDFVEQVSIFMDSADLFLTKPGGLSVSEALSKGLPMVLIQAVEGVETHNMNYCLKLGAAVTAKAPKDLAALCLDLLLDDRALAKMRAASAGLFPVPAAEAVCDRLLGAGGIA